MNSKQLIELNFSLDKLIKEINLLEENETVKERWIEEIEDVQETVTMITSIKYKT